MEGLARKLEKMEEISSTEKWTGYVWYSDQKKPEILKEEALKLPTDNKTFIIEALLHDGGSKSIHILHTHQYQITEYDLTKINQYETHEIEFIAVGRIQDQVNKITFLQIWAPKDTANCVGLKVLNLQATIFVGFN